MLLNHLSALPLRSPAAGIRRRLFGPRLGEAAVRRREVDPSPVGLAAWLMPVGAAAVALLGWVGTPGFPLRAVAGETNAALRVDFAGFPASSVNCVPAGWLTSTLSNAAPSTNVSVHGWN